jgi:hypothetical protein
MILNPQGDSMKHFFALAFITMMVAAPVAQAVPVPNPYITGSTAVIVSSYSGISAGILSPVITTAGGLILDIAGKEAAFKAAQNDIATFEATGKLSPGLKTSIESLQLEDPTISESEALDKIVQTIEDDRGEAQTNTLEEIENKN